MSPHRAYSTLVVALALMLAALFTTSASAQSPAVTRDSGDQEIVAAHEPALVPAANKTPAATRQPDRAENTAAAGQLLRYGLKDASTFADDASHNSPAATSDTSTAAQPASASAQPTNER